jgi:hypothetical protein
MATASKFLTDGADIDGIGFGPHADTHFSIQEFFKEHRHDDAANRAQMIDQAFVILGKNPEIGGCFQCETKTRHLAFLLEAHGSQQFP